MNRRSALHASAAILATLLLAFSTTVGAAPRDDSSRPFHWIDDEDYYPFIYRDEQGEPAGIYRELMEALFRRLGIPLTVEVYPWKRAQKYVIEGRGDGMITAMTRERRRHFLATDPIYVVQEHAFARLDNPRIEAIRKIRSIDDLQGFRIVETIGSGWSEENFSGLDVIWVPDFESGIRMLAEGRVDIFVMGRYAGMIKIQKRIEQGVPYAEKLEYIVPASPTLAELPYSLLIRKDSPFASRLAEINRVLLQMKRDGSYQAILDKYLSPMEKRLKDRQGE